MTELGTSGRRALERREARRAKRRRILRIAILAVGGVVLFLAGLALGKAVEKVPEPQGDQTFVRTLTPGTLPPVTRTVTVTTTTG
jgi:hypothetical protein